MNRRNKMKTIQDVCDMTWHNMVVEKDYDVTKKQAFVDEVTSITRNCKALKMDEVSHRARIREVFIEYFIDDNFKQNNDLSMGILNMAVDNYMFYATRCV